MIDSDVIDRLPEDPDLAFATLCQAALGMPVGRLTERQEFLTVIASCADELGQGFFSQLASGLNPADEERFGGFRAEVSGYSTRMLLRNRMRQGRNLVRLSGSEKDKIRDLAGKIRQLLEGIDLQSTHRERLLAKLNALVSELDRERTSTQRVSDAWLEVCTVVGMGFERLSPARKWLDDIAAIMGASKAVEEAIRTLPPGEAKALLEGPDSD